MGPSVRGERVGMVGDLGTNAASILVRWAEETARAKYGAACGAYPSPEVGKGIPLFSDAASTWRTRLYGYVCAAAVEKMVPN